MRLVLFPVLLSLAFTSLSLAAPIKVLFDQGHGQAFTIEKDGETYPLFKVEISATSHPFYTGKMKLVDSAGRVDKFRNRYAKFKK